MQRILLNSFIFATFLLTTQSAYGGSTKVDTGNATQEIIHAGDVNYLEYENNNATKTVESATTSNHSIPPAAHAHPALKTYFTFITGNIWETHNDNFVYGAPLTEMRSSFLIIGKVKRNYGIDETEAFDPPSFDSTLIMLIKKTYLNENLLGTNSSIAVRFHGCGMAALIKF